MDRKKYIVVQKDKTSFSQVINDCETGLCVPAEKGENLNSILKKLCALILKKSASADSRIYNGILQGDKDGFNAIFNTTAEYVEKSTAVFVNGQRMKLNFDYMETNSTTITFTFPIYAEDQLIIDYTKK